MYFVLFLYPSHYQLHLLGCHKPLSRVMKTMMYDLYKIEKKHILMACIFISCQ